MVLLIGVRPKPGFGPVDRRAIFHYLGTFDQWCDSLGRGGGVAIEQILFFSFFCLASKLKGSEAIFVLFQIENVLVIPYSRTSRFVKILRICILTGRTWVLIGGSPVCRMNHRTFCGEIRFPIDKIRVLSGRSRIV